jgi:tetratricopeptide (TPR) repeat protein
MFHQYVRAFALACLLAGGTAYGEETPPATETPQKQEEKPAPQLAAQNAADSNIEIMNDWSEGDFVSVGAKLKQAREAYPDDARLAFLEAACVRGQFLTSQAIALFQEISNKHKRTLEGNAAAALVFIDMKKSQDKAFKIMETLVERNPDDIALRWMYGVVLYTYGMSAEAAAQFEQIKKSVKSGPAVFYHAYANTLADQKKFEEALPLREAAVKLDTNPVTVSAYTGTLVTLGKPEAAAVSLSNYTKLNPRSALIWNQLGDVLDLLKKEEAVVAYDNATKVAPNDPIGWSKKGMFLMKAGKHQESLPCLENAMRLQPVAAHLRNLSNAQYNNKDYEGFYKSGRQLVYEMNTTDKSVRYNLACAAALTGRQPECLAELRILNSAGQLDRKMITHSDFELMQGNAGFKALLDSLQ